MRRAVQEPVHHGGKEDRAHQLVQRLFRKERSQGHSQADRSNRVVNLLIQIVLTHQNKLSKLRLFILAAPFVILVEMTLKNK